MKSRRRMLAVGVALLAVGCAPLSLGAAAGPVGFARPPSVRKAADGYVITFTVTGPCDATVAVVDKTSRVVRHLASGVLGRNAPEPFRKNSLAQALRWDGRDDRGRPVPPGCSVRVGLGLRARFDRFLFEAEPGVASRGPVTIACDGEGALYVLEGALWEARVTTVVNLKKFDREGHYLGTVIPFRSDWPQEKVSAVEFLDTADGRRIPLSGPNGHRPFSGFLPGVPGMRRHTAQITRDGRFLFACGRPVPDESGWKSRRLLAVGTDGSCPKERFIGPPLPKRTWYGEVFFTLSPDERWIYYTGTYTVRKGLTHAVYRVRWTDRKPPAKPFLGTEFEPGNDERHFNQPRGLATDRSGRLYVCDYMNDRIQLFSAEGTFLKTLKVRGPEQVVVHPVTGAMYVLSVRDRGAKGRYSRVRWELYADKSIIKFRSADEFREVCRIDLPKRRRYFHDCPPVLCLDRTARPPILWAANVGHQAPGDFLWKIVDRGDRLERVAHKIRRYPRRQSVIAPHIAAAREHNEFYMVGAGRGIVRIDPLTGRSRPIPVPKPKGGIGAAEVGPRGMLYLSTGELLAEGAKPPSRKGHRDMVWRIRRYTREGRLVPFRRGEAIETLGHHVGTYTGEKCAPFAVAPDGKVYVVEYSTPLGPRCRVNLYAADGTLLRRGFIADMTRTAGDVAVDGQGRLYVADAVKPNLPGVPRGREVPAFLGADPRGHFRMWYGVVCRFGPEGGSFRHLMPGDVRKATHWGYRNAPVVIEGAEWEYFGVAPMTQGANCECVVARIDADGWGRVFVPDVPTYSVQVLDRAGNLMMRFGEYGNPAARGPGSRVPKPEIPLWFPFSVAALDSYVAVADSHNRRVVQVRLGYAAERSVPLP